MSLLREASLEMADRIHKCGVPGRRNGKLWGAVENFEEALAFNDVSAASIRRESPPVHRYDSRGHWLSSKGRSQADAARTSVRYKLLERWAAAMPVGVRLEISADGQQ